MKDYLRDLSEFVDVVKRTGRLEYGLRAVKRHVGYAKLVVSSGLAGDEVRELAKSFRGAVIIYGDVTPAELGSAVGRPHPVSAFLVSSLGDADLDRLLASAGEVERAGLAAVIAPGKRR